MTKINPLLLKNFRKSLGLSQKEIAKTLKNDYLKNFKYFKSSIDNEKLINAIRDEINKY